MHPAIAPPITAETLTCELGTKAAGAEADGTGDGEAVGDEEAVGALGWLASVLFRTYSEFHSE